MEKNKNLKAHGLKDTFMGETWAKVAGFKGYEGWGRYFSLLVVI